MQYKTGDRLTARSVNMWQRIQRASRPGPGILRTPRGTLQIKVRPLPAPLAGSSSFSGTAYVAGVVTTGLNSNATKLWVKCDVETRTATEEYGPPSNPFPPNEEWYAKASTAGDIHVTRL